LNPGDTIFKGRVQAVGVALRTRSFKGYAPEYIAYGPTFIAPEVALLAVKTGLLFRKVFPLVLRMVERDACGSRRWVRRKFRMPITEGIETLHVACLAALGCNLCERCISTLMLAMALTAFRLRQVWGV
jgi:hypothetical protein